VTELPSLSLDPIGEFLTSRHPPDADPAAIERDRVRLARFRHAFPGLSLSRLGATQVVEYVEEMQGRGDTPTEVKATSELCHAFIRFAQNEPDLGSGLLTLPDAEPTIREDPYMLEAPAPGVTAAPPRGAAAGGGAGVAWLIIVGFLALVGLGVYVFVLRG
jgi:hypothetical protein